MKAIVDAAVKASGWIKEMHKAVEDTAKAGEGGNEPIANVAAGGVGAAETSEGKKADQAKDAVAAAIGEDGAADGAGQAFGENMRNKNDQIAAAIVLRGLAKDGKFANTSAGVAQDDQANKDKVKAAVKSAVDG
ncbi:variable large family protein (plasmid) [Borreliella andersonii]|uniref:Variable large family protein n=1 Tax=Borrelia andersonii TaxID=42109 RepID=A0ACD5G6G6_BORAD